MESCLICNESISFINQGGFTEVACPRCGSYKVTSTVFGILRQNEFSPRQLANISGWLRENPGFQINSDNLEKLTQLKTPSFHDRADKLLLNIERLCSYAGEMFQNDESWLSMAWAINGEELSELIDFLVSVGRLHSFAKSLGGGHHVKIAPEGWAHLEVLKGVNSESKQGFVAMWFGDEMQPVYDDAISVGIELAGYKPHRVDLRDHNEKIDDEIIAQIKMSRFVVADFTGHRGGVYYEAGFAKGLGLEVIWTCRDDDLANLHFDIRQYNCILWNSTDLEGFSKKIQNRIEATIGRG